MAVTPDGQHIISGSRDKLVQVWSVASKSLVSTCRHNGWVRALAAMPDGQRFLSGSTDVTVRVWLLDGTPEKTFRLHNVDTVGLRGAARRQHALSGSGDRTVKLFNVNDLAILRTMTHHTGIMWPWRCCPTASASSAARPTTPPASPTTGSRRISPFQ